LLVAASVSKWIRLRSDVEARYTFLGGNHVTGIKGIPARKLVALQFSDPSEFRRAARFVAENKIRADAPGRSTLIVRISDRHLFEDRGFKFREFRIADPEHVSSKTLSRLRLAGTKW